MNNIGTDQLAELRQLDSLEFIAKQVVEGFIIGQHKSPFHGFSVEFAEHRLYNAGDAIKNIDWKVYARTNRLYTKRFEEETNLRCHIILDASSSMYYPADSDNTKIKFSIMATAAMMYLMKKQRDAFGLTIFSDGVDVTTQDKSTQMHFKLLVSYLEQLLQQPKPNKKTAAATSLHEVADKIHRRSLVIVFSDMMDNLESQDEFFSALQHLKYNKHEVVLFDVHDKASEIDFEFENRPYEFVDLETGEKIKVQSNQVKEFYIAQMDKQRQQLKLKCAQYHIDLVEADISKDFRQVLIPYLTKRNRMS